jgi:hypothetical protein
MIDKFFTAYNEYKTTDTNISLEKVYKALLPICKYVFNSFVNRTNQYDKDFIFTLCHDLATDTILKMKSGELEMEKGILTYLKKRSYTIINKSILLNPLEVRTDFSQFEISNNIDNYDEVENEIYLNDLPVKMKQLLKSHLRFTENSPHFTVVMYELLKGVLENNDPNVTPYVSIIHNLWKFSLLTEYTKIPTSSTLKDTILDA